VIWKAQHSLICEHLQVPLNAGSRPEAPFFNSLLGYQGFSSRL
jgi:hypothetical protein